MFSKGKKKKKTKNFTGCENSPPEKKTPNYGTSANTKE
jgi:hypothetical protein